jgi:hypothetical protein
MSALFYNYSLWPSSYQPSGHVNVSRIDFYLEYEKQILAAHQIWRWYNRRKQIKRCISGTVLFVVLKKNHILIDPLINIIVNYC